MLNTAAYLPMQPSRFLSKIMALFTKTTHGSATYSVVAGQQLIHEQTVLSYQPLNRETPEAFIDRVRSDGAEGDMIEFTLRDGKIVTGKITRRSALPLQVEPGETLEAYVRRLPTYKGTLPQA